MTDPLTRAAARKFTNRHYSIVVSEADFNSIDAPSFVSDGRVFFEAGAEWMRERLFEILRNAYFQSNKMCLGSEIVYLLEKQLASELGEK